MTETKSTKKKTTTKKKVTKVVAESVDTSSVTPDSEVVPVEDAVPEIISAPVIKEIEITIASSTPTKDFALSVVGFLTDNPDAVITVKGIGAGATHQCTKGIVEVNKILIARGKMVSRFDFWTNSEGKSVMNTRLIMVDVLPNSLATALTGHNVTYQRIHSVNSPVNKE